MRSKKKFKDFCIFGLPGIFFFAAVVIVPFVYGPYLYKLERRVSFKGFYRAE